MSKVKERPIIFSGDQVRAILDGQKTSTRRTLKWQPLDVIKGKVIDGAQTWVTLDTRDPNHGSIIKCRHGEIGDRLWVKETWAILQTDSVGLRAGISYRSDQEMNPFMICYHPRVPKDKWGQAISWFGKGRKWHSARFMPRWASRILLEITDVRVERLQEIETEGAFYEGIENVDPYAYYPEFREDGNAYFKHYLEPGRIVKDPIVSFSTLWDSINAKLGHPWESNCWVWVIEFKRIEP